ncbi:response regulator [candidate division KSB1 bacterium]
MSHVKNILVVDDEKSICHNCEKILAGEDTSVFTALSGFECLRLLDERRYDLVVLDIKIPDIDGLTLLRQIKEKSPQTSVIIITGYPTLKNTIEAKKLGAAAFVIKPFTPDELLEPVKEIIADNNAGHRRKENIVRLPDISSGPVIAPPPGPWSSDAREPVYYSDTAGVRLGKDITARVVLQPLFIVVKGRIIDIMLPVINQKVGKTAPCCTVRYIDNLTSKEKTEEICSPVTGNIIETNPGVIQTVNRIIDDPFRSNWLFRLHPSHYYDDLESLNPRVIVLADDNDLYCVSLVDYLCECGYSVVLPEKFDRFLNIVKWYKTDLVILGDGVFGQHVEDILTEIRMLRPEIDVFVISEVNPNIFTKIDNWYNIHYFSKRSSSKRQLGVAVNNAFIKIELDRYLGPYRNLLSNVY